MRAATIGSMMLAALLMAAADADAQGRGRGNGNRERNTARGAVNSQGNGPAFCRSGEGHPVHGWEWCREKGWDRSGRLNRVDRSGRVIDRDGRVIDRDGRVITRDGGIVVVPDTRDGDIAIPRRTPRDRDDDDRDREAGGWFPWPF